MSKKLKMRSTYRFVGGRRGRVSKINFESLRKGDYFFMEESNGAIVVSPHGNVIFKCKDNSAKLGNLGNARVNVREVA